MQIVDLFDPALLNKYNVNGPRYTSYPTALEFDSRVTDDDLYHIAEHSKTKSLSLYIHIPFCHTLCYYCGCNKIVTRHQEKADRYLDYLEKEIQQRAVYMTHYQVEQIHLGGGTPSFLTAKQLARLMTMLASSFNMAETLECGIEIDPRGLDTQYLDELVNIGFNRLSIGVQDTDEKVQDAINRRQSSEHIAELVKHAQNNGFNSVNLDLIYGLPHQSTTTFASTLATVKAMDPQRISLFSYAHLPARFAAQRKIKDAWMPNAATKLALMKQAMQSLTAAGYQLIGMDHFAKENDELAKAQSSGSLHRNFQGYTTKGGLDLLGLGVSSISAIDTMYGQNPKTLNDYYSAIDTHRSIVCKGVILNQDDVIRRKIIMQLMCNLHLDIKAIERDFKINFSSYFHQELKHLDSFIEDGLVTMTADEITVAPKARLLIRIICMGFDAYLQQSAHLQKYSRVI
jgi:oxygen-independent coproporphyrinogen-3 oxidase